MTIFGKFTIPSITKEEILYEITKEGIKYRCPSCMGEVLWFQSKCDCGQRLKYEN